MEEIIYTTPDKRSLLLTDKSTFILEENGNGMAPLEYITERGPFQHGETMLDVFLRPRILQYHLRVNCKNRDDVWKQRNKLLDYFRPRDKPGTLTYVLSGYVKRAIDVYVQEGPEYIKEISNWDEHSIDTTIRFIAHDPTFYNPNQKSITAISTGALYFPITFPIKFITVGLKTTINYVGNWITYPRIRVTGPIDNVKIENLTTNEAISLIYSLSSNRTLEINLTYGYKTIELDDGTNLLHTLTPESNIATFHLQPGINELNITGSGQSTSTKVTIFWYERFVGI